MSNAASRDAPRAGLVSGITFRGTIALDRRARPTRTDAAVRRVGLRGWREPISAAAPAVDRIRRGVCDARGVAARRDGRRVRSIGGVCAAAGRIARGAVARALY